MKGLRLLNNAIAPGTLGMNWWTAESRCIQELILRNAMASQQGITAMHLNISKLTALAEDGTEYPMAEFTALPRVELPGLQSGRFIKTKSAVSLAPGHYPQLRFYLRQEGNIFCKQVGDEACTLEYLDFEIDGGLTITGSEGPELLLRFDFPAPPFIRIANPLKKVVVRSKNLAGKLVRSFG